MVIKIRKPLTFIGLLGLIFTSLTFYTQKSYAVDCSCLMNEFCNRLYNVSDVSYCKSICELISHRNKIKHLMVFVTPNEYGPDTEGCRGKPCISPIYPHNPVTCPSGK
jgi:hypothetical protein